MIAIDPRHLIPGVEVLAENRVALLEVDHSTVAAVLAGANHEIAREFVWREFPTLPGNTFFHRFWDTGPNGADDTGPIAGWDKEVIGVISPG